MDRILEYQKFRQQSASKPMDGLSITHNSL
uniref:Uncharacterized protein n=1 Tax=Arundo donax TaxID=35708 RepID=A0A0A9FZM1_ARUDO